MAGRAAKAMGGKPRKKALHAPRGVTEGGQFIGRSSILHGIVRLLTGGGVKGTQGAPGSVTADPRMDFKRPRLLAQARKRGVKLQRGAPQRDVVAALRARSKADRAVPRKLAPKRAGVPLSQALPGGAAKPMGRATAEFQREAKQAQDILDNWEAFGRLDGFDATALMDQLPKGVIERLAIARGMPPTGPRAKLQFDLIGDAARAHKGLVPHRAPGDVPREIAKFFRKPEKAGGRVDASGLAAALSKWRQGAGPSDPFAPFATRAVRGLAWQRGLPASGIPRSIVGRHLLSDERRKVRAARNAAANPPVGVMPGAPIIGNETRFHRDISDVRDIADGVAQGVAKKKMANQGQVGETWIETLKNGLRVIHKWSKRDWAGADATMQADAEQLASMLGRAIGAPVPKVYRHNDVEIYMGFIDRAKTGDEFGHGPYGGGMPTHIAASDGARRIGILDLLANNFDRHHGNYMVDASGQVWGIDHGLAWAPNGLDFADRKRPPSGTRTVFTEHFVDRGGIFGDNQWKRNDFTQAEWADMRRQVEALRPDFDRLGRGHWHEFAMARLDALAQHASDSPAPPGARVPRGRPGGLASAVRKAAPGAQRAAAALAQPTPSKLARGRRLPTGVGVGTAAANAIVAVKRKPAGQGRGILRGQPVGVLREIAVSLGMRRGDIAKWHRDQLIGEILVRLR